MVDDGDEADHFVVAPLCIRNLGTATVQVDWSTFDVIDTELACSSGEEADACGEIGELSSSLVLDPGTSPEDSALCTTSPQATVAALQQPEFLVELDPGEVAELCVHAIWGGESSSQTDQVRFRLRFDAVSGVTEPPPTCVDDGFEDNDDIASATPYTGPTAGQICTGDRDVFAYQHPGGDLLVEVSHDPSVGDLDVTVRQPSGFPVASGTSTDPVERVRVQGLAPGTYDVEVFGFEGAEGPYQLSISSPPSTACVDDAAEPNDTPATAAAFDGSFDGIACNGNTDYFVYQHPGGDFHAFLDFDAPTVDLDLALTNTGGSVIVSAQGTTSDETIDRPGLPAGTYLLRVTEFIDAGSATYSLTAGPPILVPPPGGEQVG